MDYIILKEKPTKKDIINIINDKGLKKLNRNIIDQIEIKKNGHTTVYFTKYDMPKYYGSLSEFFTTAIFMFKLRVIHEYMEKENPNNFESEDRAEEASTDSKSNFNKLKFMIELDNEIYKEINNNTRLTGAKEGVRDIFKKHKVEKLSNNEIKKLELDVEKMFDLKFKHNKTSYPLLILIKELLSSYLQ